MTHQNNQQFIFFPLGEKEVIWISKLNRYIIAEKWSANIIKQLNDSEKVEAIASRVALDDELDENEALELVKAIRDIWLENISVAKPTLSEFEKEVEFDNRIYSKKKYAVNGLIFEVDYQTANAEWFNHPKFSHLETDLNAKPDHLFRVGDSNGNLSIWVDGKHEGSWKQEDNHFLSGRFSMKLIEKIYGKEEKEWMGVFHAAGISNGKHCLLFFGESGNGKSTLSALSMASGLDVLSDDFLPVESKSGLVYRFPAALSIKKNAYDLVKKLYPQLMEAHEYENPAFGKTYRYLPPSDLSLSSVPCKAIIEVKYDSETTFKLEEIPPEEALTKMIPDSWINDSANHARNFINWFVQKKHFMLRYSDNAKMIAAVKQLLKDE